MTGKILVFIFGSIVGSFLNVCIHRLPLGESVVWPHSHCPKCQKKIPAYDNIPFLSYLLLRGRCRFCKERISLRYPLVELLTAIIFLALFKHYGLSYDFVVFMVLACALVIATFVDIQHRIIPDEVSIGGMILGFILTSVKGFALKPLSYNPQPLYNSLLGIITGGGIIYLTGFLFDLIYFKLLKKPPIQGETESMGLGDVKLLAMIGAFLGWQKVILVFFLASFFGVVIGVINLIVKKDHTLPYGPFLSLAAIFSIFWAAKIIHIFLPLY
ncbi:MAG: prepilin peptidase [Candidatus Omnitrophica bacterium]|nr:prepilin peptidase [Candidatus Omnitrophota bacterium]MDD5592905.1 prepilin peptidase [Candidatus Omnitrophota bacterium]